MIGSEMRLQDAEREQTGPLADELARKFGVAAGEELPLETLLSRSDSYFWEWDLETGDQRRVPSTEQVFGVEKATLEPVFENYLPRIHRDDRRAVRSTLERAIKNGSEYEIEYAVSLPETSTVWIEEHGTVLADADGTPIRVVGISKIHTESNAHGQDLQWEDKLNQTLWEALLESQTRADLEAAIVRQLSESGCDLVWIGDWLADQFQTRAVAGKQTYLDAISLGARIDTTEDSPSVTAAREGESQFVEDFDSRSDTAWGRAAQECGFTVGIALPIVYNDMCYGVLSVYSDGTDGFDESKRKRLSELADTLALVTHNIETESVLAANRTIKAKLQLVRTDYYLSDIICEADYETSKTRINVHETLRGNDGQYIQYVSVDGPSVQRIAELAAEHPVVEDVTVIPNDNGPRIQLILTEETPETVLTGVGTRIRSTSVTAEKTDILIEVPTKLELKSAITALEESEEDVSVLSCIERNREKADPTAGPLAELTDRQATVLRAAYHQGYFEQPREASATEVAASLDISHPTLLEHLRLAQKKVFQTQFVQS